jgi:DNA polymerase V
MLIQNVLTGPNIKDLKTTLDSNFLSDATFIGRASGNSMEEIGIFNGDILIIDRSKTIKNYDVIVACLNGQFVCKIADLKNNLLLSANSDHSPVKLTKYDQYNIEGVVTQSIRMHRANFTLG